LFDLRTISSLFIIKIKLHNNSNNLFSTFEIYIFMAFNIVLIEPEIPNNTGNIGRLSLGTGSTLHLVKPFGFEITDTRLKRAGLDYWQHVNIVEYDSIANFYEKNKNANMVYFSSHGEKAHWDI